MSRRRRRKHRVSASFFAFQDIIAGVTGVMLIITLVLVVQLMQRTRAVAGPGEPPPDIRSLKEQVSRARNEKGKIEKSISGAKEVCKHINKAGSITSDQVKKLERQVRDKQRELNQTADATSAAEDEKRELEQELEAEFTNRQSLKDELADTKDKTDNVRAKTRITLLRGKADGKKPFIVECARDRIVVGEIAHDNELQDVKTFEGRKATSAFLRWAKARTANTEYFVFQVRLDGIARFDEIKPDLLSGGFKLGWAPCPSSRILFPRP